MVSRGSVEQREAGKVIGQLRLHHQLLLLALCDREGTLAFGRMLNLGLGGALLTELMLAGRVKVVREGRKYFVETVRGDALDDPLLDTAQQLISNRRRRATGATIVSSLGRIKGLRHLVAAELCRKGILKEREDRILFLFRRKAYPTVDPRPERELVDRIRAVIKSREPPDERMASLIALADTTRLLGAVYGSRELKALKPRIKDIIRNVPGGDAARQAVIAVQAAVTAAAAAAAAAAG